MAVGQKRSRGGTYALRGPAFNVESEAFAMLTLENSETCTGVQLGQNPSEWHAALQFDGERNPVFTSVVDMKAIECQGMVHALTTLRMAMSPLF